MRRGRPLVRKLGLLRAGWQDFAACIDQDQEIFYEDSRTAERKAKSICERCPVLEECREFAIETNEEWGIWGGTTPPQRARIRRYRRENQNGLVKG